MSGELEPQANPDSSRPQDREEWLSTEGRIIYNALGSELMEALETELAESLPEQLSLEPGSLESTSRAMGHFLDAINKHLLAVVEEMGLQDSLDEAVVERAWQYASAEAPTSADERPVDALIVEGLMTEMVMSARLTMLHLGYAYKPAELDPDITLAEVADVVDSSSMRSMLLTAARAGQAFWGPYSMLELDDSDGAEVQPFGIAAIERAFIDRFARNGRPNNMPLDDLVVMDNDRGPSFTNLARQIMQEYRDDYNVEPGTSAEGIILTTGDCPVALGRLALGREGDLAQDIIQGHYGARAQDAVQETDGEEILVQFDPLIPRVNTYFANLIRSADQTEPQAVEAE